MPQPSIIDRLEEHVTADELQTVATAIGEPVEKTRVAVRAGIDAVGRSLSQRVATKAGAASVWETLHTPMFGGVERLWSSFLGDDGERVDDAVADASGLNRAAAHRVVAALLPIVATVLLEETSDRGVDVDGLQKLVEPPGARAASIPVAHPPARREPVTELATAPRTKPVWLPLAVVLGAMGLGAALLLRSSAPSQTAIPEPVPVAGAPEPTSVTSTTSAEMEESDVLVDGFEAVKPPAKVTLEGVAFDSHTANLSGGKETIDELTFLMNEHPSAMLRIEGHTDNTGNEAANEALSLKQAAAVKKLLVKEGVSANRIDVVGMGQRVPVAPNDTEEGRAKNRRIDVVIRRR